VFRRVFVASVAGIHKGKNWHWFLPGSKARLDSAHQQRRVRAPAGGDLINTHTHSPILRLSERELQNYNLHSFNLQNQTSQHLSPPIPPNTMAWALVTPSSRGIGFALTRHLLRTTPASVPIVATARSDVPGTREKLLADLSVSDAQRDRLDVQHCDVLEESSIADLAGHCKERYGGSREKHLRLGLLVPGMLVPEKAPDKMEYETALETVKLNLLAPMMLVKYFSGMLPKKAAKLEGLEGLPPQAVLGLMSARVGSIGDNRLGGWYSYRASKAGVNQLVKSVDIYLGMQSKENAMCVGMHPGTVKTGLSEEFWASTPKEKLFSPEFAAESLIGVVNGLGAEGRGKCWDWAGKEIPP
jgi:NAD(P)-dependent dehydrogenase (short-subunit alcohol dehydrogenase family)